MTDSRENVSPKEAPAGAAEPAPLGREGVPRQKAERDRIRAVVRQYVSSRRLIPPFSVDELRMHSEQLLAATGAAEKYRKFIAVLVSNEAWRDSVAAVPLDRRLLLLPKCLRSHAHCQGSTDALGLVCAECGQCPIADLKREAEALGYVVLVAEGTPAVMTLIRSHQIEAVVGVSCLSALESIYPLMESAAVPGIAIPLLYDGCEDTAADLDWVREAMKMVSGETSPRLDIDALRREIEGWFSVEAIDQQLGPAGGETERIARAWLAKAGKRWRPLLAVCVYRAISGKPDQPLPRDLRQVAMAVECFHKASLVHDDIEDADDLRYGEHTLHQQYGIPVALNVGDFLLGEGYRLLADCGLGAEARWAMLAAAARGHRDLTLGQGAELCWARSPRPLAVDEVIDIFRRKTAPAFEVALRLGATVAGATDELWPPLHGYSEALGVAYQIADDLSDGGDGADADDVSALRPSILLALAYERATGQERRLLESVWRRIASPADAARAARCIESLGARREARRLMESYEEAAIRSIEPVASADLKGLLRRVVFKIFRRHWQRGHPGEPEAGDAQGGRQTART